MSEPILRTALPLDAARLARLSDQLGYAADEVEVRRRLDWITGQDGNMILVAELDGEVVGWIHAFVAYRLESAPFAELGGLVVDRDCRRAGIGRLLVMAAARWAKDRGLEQVRVRCNAIRAETHEFYRRLGFAQAKTQLVFGLALKD